MNLIFDLGGVVVRWDPDAIIAGVFADDDVKARVRDAVFGHADWLELDRGTLGRDDAIRRAAQRSGIPEGEVRKLLLAVPPSLVPFQDTVDLLYRLKAKGHPLYCLSNMHFASIYEHALKTYNLKPQETVFIDDVEKNVAAAAKLGIRTIQFKMRRSASASCTRSARSSRASLPGACRCRPTSPCRP